MNGKDGDKLTASQSAPAPTQLKTHLVIYIKKSQNKDDTNIPNTHISTHTHTHSAHLQAIDHDG
jgi:hypothetical protein